MLERVLRMYREAYSGLSRTVWLLALVSFVNRAGMMVLPFLVLYLNEERGLDIEVAGSYLAIYGAGSLVGTYLGGVLTDRTGPRSIQLASLLGAAGSFLGLAVARHPWTLAVWVAAVGLFGEGFRPANATALSRASTPRLRARAFAVRRLAVNLGITFGPAVGGFLALIDYTWLFLVDAATCLAAAGLLVLLIPAGRPAAGSSGAPGEGGTLSPPSPWRDGAYLVFLALLSGLALVLFQVLSTFPLTLRDLYGLGEDRIGLLFAVNTLIIVVFEMILVHSARRRPPLVMLALGAVLLGSGFGLLPFGTSFAFAALAVVVWTCGEMLLFPIGEAVAANRAGEASAGSYLGLFSTAFGVAFVLAQVVGPWVYASLGPRVLWPGCTVLGVVLAAGLLGLGRWLDVPPPEEDADPDAPRGDWAEEAAATPDL